MPPEALLDELPLVAILRGITPDRADRRSAHVLHDAGIRAIEVPLNSPDPFDSIARLAAYFGDACICGAGTVLARGDVDRVFARGRHDDRFAQYRSNRHRPHARAAR